MESRELIWFSPYGSSEASPFLINGSAAQFIKMVQPVYKNSFKWFSPFFKSNY